MTSALWHAPVHMKHADPQSMRGSEAQRQQSGLREQLQCENCQTFIRHYHEIVLVSPDGAPALRHCTSAAH